ncbi:MAG: LolC/E family lipoprotein releasing system, transrane protein, partial [Candidatus Saccharibacteria bacterium]|nr:LolC/E family lipoprotein releasing system, transrane protein [Candidatus Saccharibacteria bacterium]
YVAPEHYLTTFQIVGIMHAQPYSNYNASVESYIKNLLSPQDYSMSAIIPLQLYEKLPDNLKIDSRIALPSTASQEEQTKNFAMRILEFSSIDQARSFLSNEACAGMELKCAKPFSADPYGSNYLLIDEIGKLFRKIINIALPVLLGLALVIMWPTISRIMAENRKETAAYRAMGAKRSDIATIYFTYVLLIALRIAAISLILGIGIAYLTDQIYGARLNDIALSSFGIISDDIRFSLFNLSSPLIWAVVGIIFVVSMVASIQPLIRNVMRSPIQDMRED